MNSHFLKSGDVTQMLQVKEDEFDGSEGSIFLQLLMASVTKTILNFIAVSSDILLNIPRHYHCLKFCDNGGVYYCEVLFCNGVWLCADVCCVSSVSECGLFLESGSVFVWV